MRGGGNSGTIASKSNNAKDLTIYERISKFSDQLKNELVYRISLRYFTNLGKITFPLKIDFRIKCHLETDLKKLFEWKKSTRYRQTLTQNLFFRRRRSSSMSKSLWIQSSGSTLKELWYQKKILRMGTQKTPIKK